MIQHTLEQRGIALQGHSLIGVLEIPVVPAEKDGDPGRGGRVNLLGELPPLLHGVVNEYIFVDIIRHLP